MGSKRIPRERCRPSSLQRCCQWTDPRSGWSGHSRRWRARCRPGRSPPPPPGRWPARTARCCAGDRIPDPDGLVVAAGGEPGAVRGDRHRPHPPAVAEDGALLRRWPHPRSGLSRQGWRWRARCRPGRSPPPTPCLVWPARTARCWPVAASQIRTASSELVGGEPGAVRGDRYRPHQSGHGRQAGALRAGGRVPDPDRPVIAGGGEPGAVRGDRHRPHRAGVAGRGRRACCPVAASQIRTVPSEPPVASQVPSGASATRTCTGRLQP